MKKITTICAVVLVAIMATSCTTTSRLASNRNTTTTNVELSQSNFNVIKNVEGKEKSTFIFGIGGLSGRAVRENSYAEMMKNANLQKSQAVVNVQTSIKRQIITPLYVKVITTTTAQVVEFK